MELATDEELPMRPSNFITGIERMPVRFTPRPRSEAASRPDGAAAR
jgi:cytochrome P450 family 142 subfamily A polypeptide 1